MKKELLKSIKIIALGLTIGLSVSFVYASWQEPPSLTDNVQGPINVGTTDQVKDGGLSVNNFIAYMKSEFSQGMKISSLADGSSSNNDRPLCVGKNGNMKVCGTDDLNAYFNVPSVTCTPWPHENCRVYVMAYGGTLPYTYEWTIDGVHGNTSLYHGSSFDFGAMQNADVIVVIKDSSSPQQTKTLTGYFDFVTGGQGGVIQG